MYERLLDKNNPLATDFIKGYIGTKSYNTLLQCEDSLGNNYHLCREMKFPFGNNYGWGISNNHKSSHLY